jgi:hypothetical protein
MLLMFQRSYVFNAALASKGLLLASAKIAKMRKFHQTKLSKQPKYSSIRSFGLKAFFFPKPKNENLI